MFKRFGFASVGLVGLVAALGACTAAAEGDDGSSAESEVTRAGSQTTRYLHTTHLQEGDVTFCLTRHPLNPNAIKFSRCNASANTASDGDVFQVVTNDVNRNGIFSYDGTKQMVIAPATKVLSFVRATSRACSGEVACVRSSEKGLTFFDPATRTERALVAVMAGAEGATDVTSGANNALDVHFGIADATNLNVQIVTKAMDRIAKACALGADGADSCATDGKVCRMESVNHCKKKCPLAAGPELWTCLDTCERPGAAATEYYERVGYCGAKNIQDRCQDGDDTVVACAGSQVWAGGFDCKTQQELFRCGDGQTCRSFVSAVNAAGERKTVEQLKSELCKAATRPAPGGPQEI